MQRILLLLAILALLILCIVCALHSGGEIENHLESGARDRLGAAGFDQVDAFVEGRDLTLAGSVPNERARARAVGMVSSLPAIRRVDHGRLSVLATPRRSDRRPDREGSIGHLRMLRDDGRVVLTGTVGSDELRTELRSAAADVFGSERLVDRLVVVPEAEGDLAEYSVREVFRAFQNGPPEVVVELDARRVWLGGRVRSETVAQDFVDRVAALAPHEVIRSFDVTETQTIDTVQADLDRTLEGKTIEFERASERITAGGRRTLEPIVQILRSAPSLTIEIGGHTDSEGLAERNLNLSRRRAAAVKQFLVDRGIAPDRLTTIAHGERRPIADNSTPEGRRRNRRIEFRVIGGS